MSWNLPPNDKDIGDSSEVTPQQTPGGTGTVLDYLSGTMKSIQDAWSSVGLESFQVEELNTLETVQRLVADGTYSPKKYINEDAPYSDTITSSQGVLKQAYMTMDHETVESKTYYLHIYDNTGTTGEKVINPIPLNMSQGDGGLAQTDFGEDQIKFDNALTIGVSTTFNAFTAPQASEKVSFTAYYQD